MKILQFTFLAILMEMVLMSGTVIFSFSQTEEFSESNVETSSSTSWTSQFSDEPAFKVISKNEINLDSEERSSDVPTSILKYRTYEIDPVSIQNLAKDNLSVPITLDGNNFDLILTPNNIFSSGHKAMVTLSNGETNEVEKEEIYTYRGTVQGLENSSKVRLTVGENFVSGFIQIDDETFTIQKESPKGISNFIIYKASETTPFSVQDIEDNPKEKLIDPHLVELNYSLNLQDYFLPKAYAGTNENVKMLLDCDKEFYDINTSNWQTRQTAVINDIEGVYSDIGIDISIIFNFCDSTNTQLTSTDDGVLREQLADRWDENPTNRHIVHLFSGKDFDGGNLGRAYLESLHHPLVFGYSLSQHVSDSDVGKYTATDEQKKFLVAHEIGHNFGGTHDAAGICQVSCTVFFDSIMTLGAGLPGVNRPNDLFQFSDGSEGADKDNENIISGNATSWLPDQTPVSCDPPLSGLWTVTKSCGLNSPYTASSDVVIDINEDPDNERENEPNVLIITQAGPLTLDFDTYKLLIKDGNRVLIKNTAKISSP